MYTLCPLKRDEAQEFVHATHRHLGAPVGDVLRVGLEHNGVLVGVAIAGRPVSRVLDDGATLEVLRVAVEEGHPQACSRLYGAIARAAQSLGFERLYTYTRADEPGISPAAAGFVVDGRTTARSWGCPSRPRRSNELVEKVRWLRRLRPNG